MDTNYRNKMIGMMDHPTDGQIEELAIAAAAIDGKTSHATGAVVLSEFYLAKTIRESLIIHAAALNASARASEKHAFSLNRATWALVVATAVMALATVVVMMKPLWT